VLLIPVVAAGIIDTSGKFANRCQRCQRQDNDGKFELSIKELDLRAKKSTIPLSAELLKIIDNIDRLKRCRISEFPPFVPNFEV
jgi:hypothetical protein